MIRLTIAEPGPLPDAIFANGVMFLPVTRHDDVCACGHLRSDHRDGGRCFPDGGDEGKRVCRQGCEAFHFDPIATRAHRAGETYG